MRPLLLIPKEIKSVFYHLTANILWSLLAILCAQSMARAQATEVYAGDDRYGIDLMWYKFIRYEDGNNSPWLFFSRNRANSDYTKSPTLFGSTNAISYNFSNGIGIVSVASFLNAGVIAKAGVQYVHSTENTLVFGWLVADIQEKGGIDMFVLLRYQPQLMDKWKIFSQCELFPVYNPKTDILNAVQRLRLGLRHNAIAGGIMVDLQQIGKDFSAVSSTENIGLFIRYDF